MLVYLFLFIWVNFINIAYIHAYMHTLKKYFWVLFYVNKRISWLFDAVNDIFLFLICFFSLCFYLAFKVFNTIFAFVFSKKIEIKQAQFFRLNMFWNFQRSLWFSSLIKILIFHSLIREKNDNIKDMQSASINLISLNKPSILFQSIYLFLF